MPQLKKTLRKSKTTEDTYEASRMPSTVIAYNAFSFSKFELLDADLQRRIRDNVKYGLEEFKFSNNLVEMIEDVIDLFRTLERQACQVVGRDNYKQVVSILDPKILRLYSYEPYLTEQIDFKALQRLFSVSKRFNRLSIDWRVQLAVLNYHNRSDLKEAWSIFNEKIENVEQFCSFLDKEPSFERCFFPFFNQDILDLIFQTDVHLNTNALVYLLKYQQISGIDFDEFVKNLCDFKSQVNTYFDRTAKDATFKKNTSEIEYANLINFLENLSKQQNISKQTLSCVLGNKFVFDFFLDNKSSFTVKKDFIKHLALLSKTFPTIELSAESLINIITGINSSITEENINLIVTRFHLYEFKNSVIMDSILLNSLLEYKRKLYCQCEVLINFNYQFDHSEKFKENYRVDKHLIMQVLYNFDDFDASFSIYDFNFDYDKVYTGLKARIRKEERTQRIGEFRSTSAKHSEPNAVLPVQKSSWPLDFIKENFMLESWKSPVVIPRIYKEELNEKLISRDDAEDFVNASLKKIELDYEARIEKWRQVEMAKPTFSNANANTSHTTTPTKCQLNVNVQFTIMAILAFVMAGVILTLIYLITSKVLQ